MKKELLKGLSKEQIAKVKACKSQDEILKLAKEEGIELNEEQLASVSGGACTLERPDNLRCPQCGSEDVDFAIDSSDYYRRFYNCKCRNCQHDFTFNSLANR